MNTFYKVVRGLLTIIYGLRRWLFGDPERERLEEERRRLAREFKDARIHFHQRRFDAHEWYHKRVADIYEDAVREGVLEPGENIADLL